MARWLGALLLAGWLTHPLAAQQKQAPPAQQEQEPPEEDETLVEKQYSFNPLQASKELQTGNFYFKKGSYKAAANRFREATKWNGGFAQAWLRLGEAQEKLHDAKGAREAYAKYLELEPQGKDAKQVRQKINKLK